jgi:hypothetical protein
MKKFVVDRPFADSARRIVEIANDVEAVQDGRCAKSRHSTLAILLSLKALTAPGQQVEK